MARFIRVSRAEKHGLELILAHSPAKFPEPKERNENAKYNKTSGEQLIFACLVESPCDVSVMQQLFDYFLDKMEDQNEQAKYNSLPKR